MRRGAHALTASASTLRSGRKMRRRSASPQSRRPFSVSDHDADVSAVSRLRADGRCPRRAPTRQAARRDHPGHAGAHCARIRVASSPGGDDVGRIRGCAGPLTARRLRRVVRGRQGRHVCGHARRGPDADDRDGHAALPSRSLRWRANRLSWLGDNAFHRSHQSALSRKDAAHYRPHFRGVPGDLPYVWPASDRDRRVPVS